MHEILKVITGSVAYGTNNQYSDLDIRGICINNIENYFGLFDKIEQYEDEESDTVIYDIQKFLSLASECNPSILEILFIEKPEHILVQDIYGDYIKAHRYLFLSEKIRDTFIGYASEQFRKIKRNRYWLFHPIQIKPQRTDYGLPENIIISKNHLGIIESLKNSEYKFDDSIENIYNKEKQYNNDLKAYKDYLSWKENRNPIRKEYEEKYGFDLKHALHLIRLCKEGLELLSTGHMDVYRPDREELKGILRGEWTYEQLEDKFLEYKNLLDTTSTNLQKSVNKEKIQELCTHILKSYFNYE